MQQVISVWVRDPRIQKNDFWHAYMDYEICLHVSTTVEKIVSLMSFPCSNCVAAVSCFQTNSVFFTKKTSRVRRRFSEFVWLRQKLQENSLLLWVNMSFDKSQKDKGFYFHVKLEVLNGSPLPACFVAYSYHTFHPKTPSSVWTTPSRLQIGWKDSRGFWKSKNNLTWQYIYSLETSLHSTQLVCTGFHQLQTTGCFRIPRRHAMPHMEDPYLFISFISQNPPEQSGVIRQLPAPFPSVPAEHFQNGGLCCRKDQLHRGPGCAELRPEEISLRRGPA